MNNIFFSGGKASGFKNITDHDTYDADGTRLFRVRGVDCDGSSCTRYLSNMYFTKTEILTIVWFSSKK